MTRHAAIVGIGSYLPDRVLTNAELEQMVDTSDEWIATRTGISERRVAADGQTTSDLVANAGRAALTSAGSDGSDIDMLVVGTTSPDYVFPSTAAVAQAKLGLNCPAFDVMAACTSFMYALSTATSAIESGRATRVLVVGADELTRYLDFQDRATCVLFGDGAGAVVLEASDEPGVEAIVLGTDGTGADILKVPAGGSAFPITAERLAGREQYIHMNGKEVFKFAVRAIPAVTLSALAASGHVTEDLAWLVPHQANERITVTVAERLKMPKARVFSNIARLGNTSSGSIPLALDELYTGGRLQPGDLVALVGFGAGLTWGAAVVRWTMPRFTRKA